MKLEGKLIAVMDEQQVTASFKKREFVIEYAENPEYPEMVKFEMIQGRCIELDKFKIGDSVSLEYNLKGRKWTDPQGVDKYFNTLQAWRIATLDNSPVNTTTKPSDEAEIDDLPF